MQLDCENSRYLMLFISVGTKIHVISRLIDMFSVVD